MKVYLDIVMFLNFFLDFLLLMSVSILLKRKTKIIRLILSSFIGGITILFLFIKINSIELFIYKFIVSIIMILVAFGYNSLKYTIKNLIYFYLTSIVLGGGLYLLNDTLSYKKIGMVFVKKGFSINILVIFIISPIIIYIYNKQIKALKEKYNNYYDISIFYNNQVLKVTGYLDTGNTLTFNKKIVLLLDKRKNIFKIKKYLLIPYNTIDNTNIMQGFKPTKIEINNIEIKNCLIGLIDNINLDGIDMILNNKIKEIL